MTAVLQPGDDGLTINLELVDGSTGTRMWAEQYRTTPDGLLAVQRRMFNDVAAQLMPGTPATTFASVPATNSESANSLLWIANSYYFEVLDHPVVDRDLLGAAIDTYRRAIEEDTGSALFHSSLAAALLQDGQIEAAGDAIQAASAIDENLWHVQHTLGLYLHARHQDGVGEHYARGVELNDNDVEALEDYSLYLWARAETERARSYLERALEIDPKSIARYETLGNFYGTSGLYDEAIELAQTIAERFDNTEGSLAVARIYELTGDLDEAIVWATLARRRDDQLEAARWKLGELYSRIGLSDAAEYHDPGPWPAKLRHSGRYKEMIDLAEDEVIVGGSPLMRFNLAWAYAVTDRHQAAVGVLESYGLLDYLERDSATMSEIEAGITLADVLKRAVKRSRNGSPNR